MSTPPAKPASALTRTVHEKLQEMIDEEPNAAQLEKAFRYLAKWRAKMVENTITDRDGRTVQSGPFKGMIYDIKAAEGAATARILGSYEAPLIPVIQEIIARAYPVILDIGCAEGYYAVGLARRMPDTRIMAHDTNPKAQETCAELAKRNAVADRIEIGGTVTHADFARCADEKALVICDIEGAEAELLDPDKAPGLVMADILVEVHDCFTPGLSKTLTDRFAKTHDVTRYDRAVDMSALPAWMEGFSDLDRLIALWEWRTGPTPWLWMRAKKSPEV